MPAEQQNEWSCVSSEKTWMKTNKLNDASRTVYRVHRKPGRNDMLPANGCSRGAYRWCSYLANDSEAVPATAPLPFRSLPD